MPWNPMESNSIPRNWNGSGIENLKISGSGMELKFENSVELEWNWNGIGMELEWNWNGIGMELEWNWNGIGMEWNWNGIGMESELKIQNFSITIVNVLKHFIKNK